MTVKDALRTVRGALLTYRAHGHGPAGTPLPPLPFRMGGDHFMADLDFVSSATAEVARLTVHGLAAGSRVLDWGCGAGRLAVGIKESTVAVARYHGIDVQPHLIRWARRHLADSTFQFTASDAANDRYNPDGSPQRHIPGGTGGYDVVYGYSVLSHMDGTEVRAYLEEIARLLDDGGFAFVTAFVEDGVEPEVENPAGYGPLKWEGPLHCVRYDRGHFDGMVADAGLTVDTFSHGTETDGQSLYVLRIRTPS